MNYSLLYAILTLFRFSHHVSQKYSTACRQLALLFSMSATTLSDITQSTAQAPWTLLLCHWREETYAAASTPAAILAPSLNNSVAIYTGHVTNNTHNAMSRWDHSFSVLGQVACPSPVHSAVGLNATSGNWEGRPRHLSGIIYPSFDIQLYGDIYEKRKKSSFAAVAPGLQITRHYWYGAMPCHVFRPEFTYAIIAFINFRA